MRQETNHGRSLENGAPNSLLVDSGSTLENSHRTLRSLPLRRAEEKRPSTFDYGRIRTNPLDRHSISPHSQSRLTTRIQNSPHGFLQPIVELDPINVISKWDYTNAPMISKLLSRIINVRRESRGRENMLRDGLRERWRKILGRDFGNRRGLLGVVRRVERAREGWNIGTRGNVWGWRGRRVRRSSGKASKRFVSRYLRSARVSLMLIVCCASVGNFA